MPRSAGSRFGAAWAKTGYEVFQALIAALLFLYIFIVDCSTINVKRKFLKMDNIFSDNRNMIEGLTVQEIADELNISYTTAHKRLERLGIKPLTTGAIYPKSALESIRNVAGKGRPPKKPAITPDPE
jgi:hypothetical protein